MQTEFTDTTIASLLPYLNRSKGNPSTMLSLTVGNSSATEGSYPFCVLNDSSPTARLLKGAFVTDAGSVLKKVFLLLQKDRYSIRKDELWPLTNRDIEGMWRQAFSFHGSGRDEDSGMVVLSCQQDGNGGLNLLSPLFFCGKKGLFFHPPCPACGLPLRLCEDDDLLSSIGLKPYSGSLKRYLHCGTCVLPGMDGFYVNERELDDPPLLKDRWSLIDEFASLRPSGGPPSPLPCTRCPEHDACFGPDGAVRSRIVPFSFYPFHLLIFDALSLNALEFLPLVSGAKPEELVGRPDARIEQASYSRGKGLRFEGSSGGFFHGTDHSAFFAEVLYLKLSFLEDVLRRFLARENLLEHPDLRPTIDRVWVDLPDRSGLLPNFWTFRTRVMDVLGPSDTAGSPEGRPSSNLLLYLGLLWFHALLVNKRQGIKEIIPVLKGGLTTEICEGGRFNPAFIPENIFWEPDGRVVRRDLIQFWQKSLELGSRLLSSATGAGLWSRDGFFDDLQRLRSELKNSLFANTPASSGNEPVHADHKAGDDEIFDILTGIIDKWSEKPEYGSATRTQDIETTETVILAPSRQAPVPPPPEPEELTETVILSSTMSIPPPSASQGSGDDPLPETLIISPGMRPDVSSVNVRADEDQAAVPPKRPDPDIDLEATVILSPRRTGEKGRNGGAGHE